MLRFLLVYALFGASFGWGEEQLSPAEIESISEEAFIYGLPMVMAYSIMNAYSIDKNSGQYKGPFNQITSEARVYTPQDTTVITPNSDTPYSFAMMDLRAEPLIICVPTVEKGRYFSVQLTSQYTFNFGYIGSRATGNEAGCYAVVGPHWNGEMPSDVKKVFRSETEFASAIFRTQLFNPTDIDNVKKIQSEYKIQPLSKFLGKAPPPAAPQIQWPKFSKDLAQKNLYSYLNFLLQFAPPIGDAAVEVPLRERFAKIGIIAGKEFPIDSFTEEQNLAIQHGIEKGMEKIKQELETFGTLENGWRVSTTGFGDRASFKGNFVKRAAAARAGIYGNDAVEALYPLAKNDSLGEPLNGSLHNYTLTFPAGQLPPVNAFWSVTMYDGKTQLLIENSIHRYLINSPMLPALKKNEDGSLTLYIQKVSPGQDKESNWLPAPDGPIYMVMRLYWPKEEALKSIWQPPAIKRS
jgi:hypothetical protein